MLRFNDKQKVIINLIQIIIKSHKKKLYPRWISFNYQHVILI